MKILFLLLTATLLNHGSFAQDKYLVDSLETQLKKHNSTNQKLNVKSPTFNDTTAANILEELFRAYLGSDLDKALNYAYQCLRLSEQIGYKKGIANAYNNLGIVNLNKGDFSSALEFHKKALKIREEIGDKKSIVSSFNQIGNSFSSLGNYPEALKNYLVCLKVADEIGYKKGIASAYNNIGMVYTKLSKYPEALKNILLGLKIKEELGDKIGISNSYTNIGIIYYNQQNYPEALKNYLASLKIREEMEDKNGIALSHSNIGTIYEHQRNYPEALKNYFASLKIHEENGNKNSMAISYNNIGAVFTAKKKFNVAEKYLNKALSIGREIRSLEDIKFSFEYLSELYSAKGNFKQSLEYFQLCIAYRDSMLNDENKQKIIQNQLQYEFDKKEASAKAEQEKKDVIALKELQRQKLVRNGFMGGFAVVLFFSGVFYTQRNKIKAGKKLSDELLLNILPSEVAEELKSKGSADAKQFDEVTVMFTDFKEFTQISEKLTPSELVAEIHTCFKAFDDIITKHNIEKIKTIGDAYMCAGGLPVSNKSHATDVVSAAIEIQQFMQQHLMQRKRESRVVFEIRIGIHTGPVVAGIVGVKKFAYDIWGDTVNIASRMESSGEAGKINISGSTYELVKTKFNCVHRGRIEAKNKGEIDMYFVNLNN